jgi:molecular chaperone GrpE
MAESEDIERPALEEKLAELDILRQSVEAAKAKEKDVYDQLLRLAAEFQNFRRKSEERLVETRKAGREDVLLNIINLADIMAQAELSTRTATDLKVIQQGVSLLKDQFEKFLTEQGLVPIRTKGEKLDPLRHEAIARVEDPNLEEGAIVDEIQRGYVLGDRVVRPSRVRVAAKPQTKVAQMNEEEQHG